MLLRPQLSDVKVIGYYTGKIIIGVGLLMIVPLLVSLVFQEWNPALDFTIGILSCLSVGFFLEILCLTHKDLSWTHGLVVASFSYLLAMVLGSIPHYLSGHFGSYLDAAFDLMSGITTTGLYLLQDLDHLSYAMTTWRQLLTYAGGQGIIVVALTFLFRGTAGAFRVYAAEGKEERLLPNVIQTARVIWLVSLIYLVAGSLALWITMAAEGMSVARGFFHGIWVFMGAWSTGGFAPQSYNIGYYHSTPLEVITLIIFTVGSLNFALHWAVWTGNRREIYRNIEIISFITTLSITVVIGVAGLIKLGVYPDTFALFRKVFYQVISGHSGTGFSNMYAAEFMSQWSTLATVATIVAMAIGGSACSTAGGIKGLRIGVTFKVIIQEIRRLVSPESAVYTQKIHHIKDTVLEDRVVRSVFIITLCYLGMYIITSLVGIYYGYPITAAIFDGISATTTTGLSAGVTSPSMPNLMKVVYIVAMWAGRLEFMSVFALVGFLVVAVRGK